MVNLFFLCGEFLLYSIVLSSENKALELVIIVLSIAIPELVLGASKTGTSELILSICFN